VATVVLFHHAFGLTRGVRALADTLRAAGHEVHTPDLYDGRVFDTLDDGLDHARRVGFDDLIQRGVRAAADVPDAVYAGISLGALPAQRLAQTRSDARGLILYEACVPMHECSTTWPTGLPVQVHGMDDDPFFAHEGDLEAARVLTAAAGETATAELHLYPGDRHLFIDDSLPSYDAAAAAEAVRRTLKFLAAVG
jgi:dienelactone hydrolase